MRRLLFCMLVGSVSSAVFPAAGEDPAAAFRAKCATSAADGEAMAIPGSDGWLFLRSELRHIGVGPFWGAAAARVSQASSPEKADPPTWRARRS